MAEHEHRATHDGGDENRHCDAHPDATQEAAGFLSPGRRVELYIARDG